MNATTGHGGRDAGAAVAAARPIMLVRYRPGVAGETARVVHLVPLPTDEQAGVVGALCGAALMVHDMETVTAGVGMPCTVCVLTHVTDTAPAEEPPVGSPAEGPGAGLAAGGACYPYTPDHHILLTGERYGVTLPRSPQVHQVTGVLLLPPTVTPRGPITWIQPPQADSLRLCREIDLFGALRTALGGSPPADPLPGGDPP